MRPIKEIAGEILLYFYTLQRRNGYGSMDVLTFGGFDEIALITETDLSKSLMKICNDSAADLYNGLNYLDQRNFMSLHQSRSTGGDSLHSFMVTSHGIDIIEGIERGQEERNNFYVTFNIKVADQINVESLLKNELGSIFDISALKL